MSRIQEPIAPTLRGTRQVQANRVVAAVIVAGSAAVAGAALLCGTFGSPKPTPAVTAGAPPAASAIAAPMTPSAEGEAERPLAADDGAEISTPLETTIERTRPVVAIAHEDTETNFEERARTEMDQGEIAEALASLRKHIYRHEPTPEVLLNIGRLARETGDHALAEEALLDAGAADPANPDIQVELARVMLDVGQLEEARLHARQAIRLDRDDATAWNVAGRIAMQQSQWHRAETALRRAVELDPTNGLAHNNLGLLYIYTHRSEDAVDSLETAVETFEDKAPYFVYNNLGLAHEMAGHFGEAKDAFEEALAVNPDYARANVNLNRVLSTIAAREDKASYQTAKEMDGKDTAGEQTPSLRE